MSKEPRRRQIGVPGLSPSMATECTMPYLLALLEAKYNQINEPKKYFTENDYRDFDGWRSTSVKFAVIVERIRE